MSHKRLSASQTKWWWNCPGAWAYLQVHPVGDQTSHHAMLGSAAHYLSEVSLDTGTDPSYYIGWEIAVSPERAFFNDPEAPAGKDIPVFKVDQDMAEAVERVVNYVWYRMEELNLTRADLHIEQQVNPLPGNADTGGTGDIILDAWPDLIEVVDYKHGSGVFVPVESNLQLRTYALGAYHMFKDNGCYERVRYTICQPRHTQSPPDGIMSEEMEVADLMLWSNDLEGAITRTTEALYLIESKGYDLEALHGKGYVSASKDGSHCTFCPLKHKCPELHQMAQNTAMVEFDDTPTDSIPVPSDPDQLAKAAKWVPLLRKWNDAVMHTVKATLMSGNPVEGQKLVKGRGKRIWKDGMSEKDIADKLISEHGLKLDDIFVEQDPKMLTGPQAEKLVPKKDRKDFNEKFLEKIEGQPSVAPESDKRQALVMDPASDFDGIED